MASKILVIGGTGYIGKFVVEESAKSGHPTFALIRDTTASSSERSKLIESFKSLGVTLINGDIDDHVNLVKAIKQVDVVISTVGMQQFADQVKIIAAIKEAGNVKRFLPSEFGTDVDRIKAVEPAASVFAAKAKIRRAIEAEGIPYTFVISHGFMGYFMHNLGQATSTVPPRDHVVILGNGNVKATFVKEEDIAKYTIKAVDDPRTLNKGLYVKPAANLLTFNEILSIWESKIGKTLEKTYIPEDQLLNIIQGSPAPVNVFMAIGHSVFVAGDSHIEIDPSFGVEATELYPEVAYETIDGYLNQFV